VIWNPEAETMAPATRRALQLARLRETVERAVTRVPFFRAALAAAGVSAGSLRGLEDLARIPFTRKDHLREEYPWGLFAVPRRELARIHASSGTKGKPTVVGYTRGDLAIWREVMARSLAAGGAEPGHLIQIAYGYGLFTGGLGFHDGAEHMGLTVVPVSSGNTLRQMLLLQDFRPDGLACTPSFALHIGEALRETGQDPRALGLRYGLFGAEPWTEAMRGQLEALWGITASDFYGLSELIGPGVAGECPAHDGLHVNDDHFLPEIVDPASGDPLGPGKEGELVLTALTREALPMLRYRTGDLTSLNPEPCACGRTTARMARVKGRSDDMVVIKGCERVSLAGGGGAVDDRGAGPSLSAGGGPHPGVPPPRRPRGARRGHRGRLGRLRGGPGPGRRARRPGGGAGCAATSASTRKSPSSRPSPFPGARGRRCG
jgi:phenylacetate-CoA ligase